MTNPPYASGPAPDPNRPPQGTAAPSFQYRPQDPGTVPYGQPTGPVLPPPPTWGQRWGLLPKDDRPRQVTVILQTLWIHLATVVAATLLGLTGSVALSIVLGVLAAAVNLVFIWAVAREQLGRFGSDDPRLPIHIGLGALALIALFRVFNVFTIVPALVQIAAALLILVLAFTKPVRAWLQDRPGNRPRKAEEPPSGTPLIPQAPPPQWRDPALPGLQPTGPGIAPGAAAPQAAGPSVPPSGIGVAPSGPGVPPSGLGVPPSGPGVQPGSQYGHQPAPPGPAASGLSAPGQPASGPPARNWPQPPF